ncbi:efflux transporter outer membrane subunit [Sphingomonas sp.]|uniref:efflux transporter outer membrane subunit n=1 Tax=Sphingomonas sp. TaxID=28214 RepID=UPI003CC56626
MKRAAALLLAGVLGACTPPTTHQRVRPASALALGLTGVPAPAIDAAWWRGFGDPQLDRVVADALAGSPTLDQALARLAQADAQLSARRADEAPQASLDAQLQAARLSGRYTIPPPYRGTVRTVGTAGINLGYNLDLFGRQRAVVEGARATALAAGLDAAAARLAIAGSVTQAYLELARAEAQATIARETIATRQGSLRLVRIQIRNQLASHVQEQAALALLDQARGALTRAQGSRALAADALAALAGRGPDYAAQLGPTALRIDAALPVPAALPADLLARRADVAASLARIDAAEAARQVARRAFYPNVNLGGLIGLQAIGLGNLLSLDAAQLGAGPAIHLPLFDGGRLRADLTGAAAGVDLTTAQYNAAVIGAVREAADALALSGNLQQQRADAAAVAHDLAETDRLNGVRVRAGLDSKLGLVDTDVRLLDARLALANLAIDAARSRVQLLLALGGGWDGDPIAAGPKQDIRP